MKNVLQKIAASLGVFFAPAVALAQTQFGNSNIGQGQTAGNVLNIVANILNTIIPILITLAVVYFIWGVLSYAFIAKEEDAKKKAREIMLNGIIALFVILAVWGILGLISSTLGIGVGGTLQSNQIPGVSN